MTKHDKLKKDSTKAHVCDSERHQKQMSLNQCELIFVYGYWALVVEHYTNVCDLEYNYLFDFLCCPFCKKEL